MTSVDVVLALDVNEARRLTDEVKSHAESLWFELVGLYDGGAHVALGYSNWQEYAETEFGMDRITAQRLLDAGRVQRAILSSPKGLLPPVPNERIARVLRPLLPPAGPTSPRTGSNEQVADAWAMVIDAHEDNGPITSASARKVLMQAGVLPDTRSGASGPPSWGEAIGQVGDDLIDARKSMDKFEKLIGEKQPVKHVREKAERYAAWADDLSARLRAVQEA